MKKQVKEQKKVEGKKRSSAYLKMFTVVVFGEARTGKSSLIKTFLGETFTDEYEPTVEDFYSKQILYNDRNYQVDIIDTCGSENFPAMRRVDIQKADAILLVYSLDNPRSFERLEQLREEIFQERGHNLPVMVVANKSDAVLDGHALEMKTNDGSLINTKYVAEKEWNLLWTITSAKMSWGVEDMFHGLIDAFYVRRTQTLPAKGSRSWLGSPLLSSLRRKSK
ncbi:ras-related protein Rap-2a-like [Orbicella faveolata]|uniref:ras-related protein Rap-2a-like n=1 Tax=Orbicella faveolata TaxID=48498 RepID=UPI0009E26268|nr:ras-related protein Rap-2a-like [Orbicella faveolata]